MEKIQGRGMDVNLTIKFENEALNDIAITLKEISYKMITQAQADAIKSALGDKADQILAAIAKEKDQVAEDKKRLAEDKKKLLEANEELKAKISELEEAGNIDLDFSSVTDKLDSISVSVSDIYEPETETAEPTETL